MRHKLIHRVYKKKTHVNGDMLEALLLNISFEVNAKCNVTICSGSSWHGKFSEINALEFSQKLYSLRGVVYARVRYYVVRGKRHVTERHVQ